MRSSRMSTSGMPPARLSRSSYQKNAADQERDAGQHREHPGRPALLAALRQRHDDRRQGQRDQRRAAQVEPDIAAAAGLRHHLPAQHQRDGADRQRQQEDRPPPQVRRVPLDQRPAAELADRGGHAHHDAVGAHRPGQFALVLEQRPDRAQHLRQQHRRRRSLDDPGDHQVRRAGGDPAPQAGQREPGHADQEAALAPVQVAQPPAGDQEHPVAAGIAGDHQLQFGRRRAQALMDRRQRDIDDEEIQRRHEPARQQYDQRHPAEGAFLSSGHTFSLN